MIESGALVYIDANICIYLLEKSPEWFERARKLFIELNEARAELITSELTVGECLIRPHRDKNEPLVRIYERYFSNDEEIRKAPVDQKIIRSAAALAGFSSLRLFDAIHMATAVAERCTIFVTNDARLRLEGGPRILRLADM